jgi:hypothetical protein
MKAIRTIYQCVICGGEAEVRELEDGCSTSAAACSLASLSGRESDYRLVLLMGQWMVACRPDDGRVDWRFLDNRANWSLEVEARPWCDDCKRAVLEALRSRRESLVKAPQMTCDFGGLRRNLAEAYNTHVDVLVEANADEMMRESCAEIGNGIAGLLALSSDDGIRDLSSEVSLNTPFGDD